MWLKKIILLESRCKWNEGKTTNNCHYVYGKSWHKLRRTSQYVFSEERSRLQLKWGVRIRFKKVLYIWVSPVQWLSFIDHVFLDACCSPCQHSWGYSWLGKEQIFSYLKWPKEYRTWGTQTCCFSDQKLSIISPEVTWLVQQQESQFLGTSAEVFSIQQTLGGSQKQEIKLKYYGDFILLWIVETKKVVYICKNMKSYLVYQNGNCFCISSKYV